MSETQSVREKSWGFSRFFKKKIETYGTGYLSQHSD